MSSVLIIESDDAVRLLLRTLLVRDGHQVVEASEDDALELILSRRWDVVLLDVILPYGPGIELLEALRFQAPQRRNIIVLTVSSPRQLASLDRTYVHSVIYKPFELDQLREQVRVVSRKHLLLVEDDEPTQYLVRRRMEEAGYRVTSTSDGREALQQLIAVEFDALIIDLRLPTVSGFDVIDHCRHRVPCPPIVVLTQVPPGEVHLEVDAVLHKPEGIEQMTSVMRRLAPVGLPAA